MAPIVCATAVIPRLSDAQSPGVLLNRQTLCKHFAYSDKNWAQGRWWTALLYMFVHSDEPHLVSNMFSLISLGWSVHRCGVSLSDTYQVMEGLVGVAGPDHFLGHPCMRMHMQCEFCSVAQ